MQFDYCVYQCFSTSLSAVDISRIMRETMVSCAQFHFRIVSIIGDGAQCNRQFQKRYFKETMEVENGQKYEYFMKHPIYGNPIFYISDPSHMVKKIVSSLSSSNRNIFKSVDGKYQQLSLSTMMNLWMSFNSLGLNTHKEFKSIDFIKNSFQAMRVGPCIKVRNISILLHRIRHHLYPSIPFTFKKQVLGQKMIDMIDHALLYKCRYEDMNSAGKTKEAEDFRKFNDADKYLGWREMAFWFTGLFNILNSTDNRLNTDYYTSNVEYLESFLVWFKAWKEESIAYRALTLPVNPTSYQSMTGFFTSEATEDCITMVSGIIQLTKYYCSISKQSGKFMFFLPRRISQDLVENHFSRVKLAIGHMRMDHKNTYAACGEVARMKEIKSDIRSMKKRNVSNMNEKNFDQEEFVDELCIEHAKNKRKLAMAEKDKHFPHNKTLTWRKVNDIEILVFC